jgi:hypothetical protein
VSIDHLRSGWPEALLTGRYQVMYRRMHDVGEILKEEVLFDIPDRQAPTLQIRIDGRTALLFRHSRFLTTTTVPAHIVLELRERDSTPWRWPWWAFPLRVLRALFGDTTHDVVDTRLGVIAGAVTVRLGLVTVLFPQRMTVLDPSGQPIGRLAERITPTGRLPWGSRRFTVTDRDGVRAARVRQAGRVLGHCVTVEMAAGAGPDPRLVLACILLLDKS